MMTSFFLLSTPHSLVVIFQMYQHMEFTLQSSYSIIVMLWTELSCGHKSYSSKATLPLDLSHRHRNYPIIITNSIFLKWQYIFSFYFLLASITSKNCLRVTRGVFYKNCLSFGSTWVHPMFSGWIRVARRLIFSIVCFCFVHIR